MNSFRLFLMNKHNSHTVLVCQHDGRFTSEAALLSVVFLVSMCSLWFGHLEAVLPERLLICKHGTRCCVSRCSSVILIVRVTGVF